MIKRLHNLLSICLTFFICSAIYGQGPSNDSCGTNISCESAEVITLGSIAETVCIDRCNNNMPDGPQTNGAGACSDMTTPTAWFTFTTGPTTNSIVFDLSSTDLRSTLFAVFSDCNTMVACNPVDMEVFPNTQYWIAVTDAGGMEGNFELCLTPLYLTNPCITEQSLNIIATSLGSDFNGPFKPCEEMTFEYQTNFIKLGAQWIHSIIPVISECFGHDSESEPTPSIRPTGNAVWNWYPSSTLTWKPLDNSNSTIGIDTVTNHLCIIGTTGCSSFKGGGNCSNTGTPLPAAWAGVVYSPICGSDEPNKSWGDNASGPFKVQFTLQVPCDACSDTICNKFIVGVTAFSDGQTGGWQANSCNGHSIVSKKLSIQCCNPPQMTLENGSTCSDIPFIRNFALEPSNSTFRWIVANANGVTGATSGSDTTFSQTLRNESNTPQTVRYQIIPTSPEGCDGNAQLLDVLVFPVLIVDAGPDKVSCAGANFTLGGAPAGTGGDGGPYTYQWSNGETTETISVAPDSTSVFTLTVTDGTGCSGSDEVTITLDSILIVDINPNTDTLCLSSLAGQTLTANSNATNEPLTYEWNTPWGNPTSKTIDITPQTSGTYTISVEVKDAAGCSGTGTSTLTLLPNPPVNITNKPQDLSDIDSFLLQSSPSFTEGTLFTSEPSGVISIDGLINVFAMEEGINYTFYATYTDVDGCVGQDSVSLKLNHGSGVSRSKELLGDIYLYPNPVSNELSISSIYEFSKVTIQNINGFTLHSYQSVTKIDVSRLPVGMYILKLQTKEGVATKAFVKM